jgi:hypothetical protein
MIVKNNFSWPGLWLLDTDHWTLITGYLISYAICIPIQRVLISKDPAFVTSF